MDVTRARLGWPNSPPDSAKLQPEDLDVVCLTSLPPSTPLFFFLSLPPFPIFSHIPFISQEGKSNSIK